jgi:hypothetical protein
LVELALQEITQPFGLIPPTSINPATTSIESEQSERQIILILIQTTQKAQILILIIWTQIHIIQIWPIIKINPGWLEMLCPCPINYIIFLSIKPPASQI